MDMATDQPGTPSRNDLVKAAFILGANLLSASVITSAIALLTDADPFHPGDESAGWAALVGWLHVAFGSTAAALRASARFLNDAEDADDLRREGRALLLGAGALIAAGASLILLALAGQQSDLPPSTVLTIVLLLNALAWILVSVRFRLLDELNRAVTRDAGHLAITWLSLVGGTWAVMAHLGLARAPSPLDWLTMIGGFGFVAGLVALGRKGGFDIPR